MPSAASSTGLTSQSGSVSNCACSRIAVSMEQLLPTYRSAVFRSIRSPDDHTSVQPHLEICSFQGRTLLPLVRGHLRSPVPLHGTVSPQNSMKIASVCWRSGKNWKLIYLSPEPELSFVMWLCLFLLLTMLLWLFRRACKNIIIIIIIIIIHPKNQISDIWTEVIQGLWNELPARMKNPSLSFDSFRKLLKTFLFDKWLLHERICGSCIYLRVEMFIILIMIIIIQ